MNILDNARVARLMLAFLSVGCVSSGVADEYHYRDILIGDRAAGLGGAFTGIADDASGLYYNPAGVVYSPIPRISGSVSAYNYRTTEYSSLTTANPDQTWTRTSSGMVANFFGVVQPMGIGVAGFSIAIPNYDLENQNDEFRDINGSQRLRDYMNSGEPQFVDQYIDFNNEDRTLLFGPSYGLQLSNNLSIGLTLYGYYRMRETTNWQYVYAWSDQGEFEDTLYQKIQTRETGIQPRLGLMWSPVDRVSLGLMVQNTFIFSQSPENRESDNTFFRASGEDSFKRLALECVSDCNGVGDKAYVELGSNESGGDPRLVDTPDNDLPVEINLGIAYFPSSELLYSADFSYAFETDIYEATWNAAFGAEYFVNPAWAVRGGFFTNNANTSRNVAEEGRDHVNLYGGAFSLSRYTASSNITLGFNYSYGEGEANLFRQSQHTQDIKVQSLSAYVSASASF